MKRLLQVLLFILIPTLIPASSFASAPANDSLPATEAEPCSICRDPYVTGEEQTTTSCNHRFHRTCLTAWLQRSPTCPLCRHGIGAQQQMTVEEEEQQAILEPFMHRAISGDDLALLDAILHPARNFNINATAQRITRGLVPEIEEVENITFFMLAVRDGSRELIRRIARARPDDINYRNHFGNAAITYALDAGDLETVYLLQQEGAICNAQEREQIRYQTQQLNCCMRLVACLGSLTIVAATLRKYY